MRARADIERERDHLREFAEAAPTARLRAKLTLAALVLEWVLDEGVPGCVVPLANRDIVGTEQIEPRLGRSEP